VKGVKILIGRVYDALKPIGRKVLEKRILRHQWNNGFFPIVIEIAIPSW